MQQARQVAVVRSAVFWLASHRWVWVFLGRRAVQDQAIWHARQVAAIAAHGIFQRLAHRYLWSLVASVLVLASLVQRSLPMMAKSHLVV